MSTSRDKVLSRVHAAVAGEHEPVTVPRGYQREPSLPPGGDGVLELLVDRLRDYRAEVHRVAVGGLTAAVRTALGTAASVVVPDGLPADVTHACRAAVGQIVVDGVPHRLSAAELDQIDAVVTTATVAVGINGTIILDGSAGQGRRIISLVPDLHVVILRPPQIVQTLPEAIARLEPDRPITMIAGPSATSDIELTRVEGVHGPRALHVLIASMDVAASEGMETRTTAQPSA